MTITGTLAIPGQAQTHTPDDVQKIGPGSALPSQPKPVGGGSAAGAGTTSTSRLPKRDSSPSLKQLRQIRSILDVLRSADARFAEAERNLASAWQNSSTPDARSPKPSKKQLADLQIERDRAREAASKAYEALVDGVYRTVIDSCPRPCTFAAMRLAADKIEEATRTDNERTSDFVRPQSAVSQAVFTLLLDAGRASLQRLVLKGDRNEINDLAAWAAERHGPTQYANGYSRLKPLLVNLVELDAKSIANDLVAACRARGMTFTSEQEKEIKSLGVTMRD